MSSSKFSPEVVEFLQKMAYRGDCIGNFARLKPPIEEDRGLLGDALLLSNTIVLIRKVNRVSAADRDFLLSQDPQSAVFKRVTARRWNGSYLEKILLGGRSHSGRTAWNWRCEIHVFDEREDNRLARMERSLKVFGRFSTLRKVSLVCVPDKPVSAGLKPPTVCVLSKYGSEVETYLYERLGKACTLIEIGSRWRGSHYDPSLALMEALEAEWLINEDDEEEEEEELELEVATRMKNKRRELRKVGYVLPVALAPLQSLSRKEVVYARLRVLVGLSVYPILLLFWFVPCFCYAIHQCDRKSM